jgi:hypothetical protein
MIDEFSQYKVSGKSSAPPPPDVDEFAQYKMGASTGRTFAPSSDGTTPVSQQGPLRRFATRALGVPDDIFDHPSAYLNPFSSDYWKKGKQERDNTAQSAKAQGWDGTVSPDAYLTANRGIPIPGQQTYEDIKAGNYAGAVGDVLPDAISLAQTVGPIAGNVMRRPGVQSALPKIGRYGGAAAGYEAGKVFGHPVIGGAAGAGVGESVGHGVAALGRKLGPVMETQGLGSFRAPDPIPDVIPPESPAPAPYRMSGSQIQDPVTVTPRKVFQPKGLLGEGTPDVPAPAEASPAPYRMKGEQIPAPVTVTPKRPFVPAGLLQASPEDMVPAAPAAATPTSVWPPERPSAIQPREFRGPADSLEDKGFQEANRQDLENHGRQAYSQNKRDWFARNVPGSAKGDLVAKGAPKEFQLPDTVSDAISQANAQGQPTLPPEGRTFSPNASGESSASLEAINRSASEATQGIKRFRIDTRSGKETPLIGVDAVDMRAGPYERIVQRGPQGETTLDQGPKARPSAATPKVATNANLEDVLKRATQGLRTFDAKAGDD